MFNVTQQIKSRVRFKPRSPDSKANNTMHFNENNLVTITNGK